MKRFTTQTHGRAEERHGRAANALLQGSGADVQDQAGRGRLIGQHDRFSWTELVA